MQQGPQQVLGPGGFQQEFAVQQDGLWVAPGQSAAGGQHPAQAPVARLGGKQLLELTPGPGIAFAVEQEHGELPPGPLVAGMVLEIVRVGLLELAVTLQVPVDPDQGAEGLLVTVDPLEGPAKPAFGQVGKLRAQVLPAQGVHQVRVGAEAADLFLQQRNGLLEGRVEKRQAQGPVVAGVGVFRPSGENAGEQSLQLAVLAAPPEDVRQTVAVLDPAAIGFHGPQVMILGLAELPEAAEAFGHQGVHLSVVIVMAQRFPRALQRLAVTLVLVQHQGHQAKEPLGVLHRPGLPSQELHGPGHLLVGGLVVAVLEVGGGFLQEQYRVVGLQPGRLVEVTERAGVVTQLAVDAREVQVGYQAVRAVPQDELQVRQGLLVSAAVEQANPLGEQGVEVAGEQVAIVRADLESFFETADRVLGLPAPEEGQAEQPEGGSEARIEAYGLAQVLAGSGQQAQGEIRAADEEMSLTGFRSVLQEEAVGLHRRGEVPEGVKAASEVQQRLGQAVGFHEQGLQQLNGPLVVPVSTCLQGRLVELLYLVVSHAPAGAKQVCLYKGEDII